MRPYNLLGNIIWLIFAGFIAALGYFIGGMVLCLTVVGIPFGLQCSKIGVFVSRQFGLQAVSLGSSSGKELNLLQTLSIILVSYQNFKILQ